MPYNAEISSTTASVAPPTGPAGGVNFYLNIPLEITICGFPTLRIFNRARSASNHPLFSEASVTRSPFFHHDQTLFRDPEDLRTHRSSRRTLPPPLRPPLQTPHPINRPPGRPVGRRRVIAGNAPERTLLGLRRARRELVTVNFVEDEEEQLLVSEAGSR